MCFKTGWWCCKEYTSCKQGLVQVVWQRCLRTEVDVCTCTSIRGKSCSLLNTLHPPPTNVMALASKDHPFQRCLIEGINLNQPPQAASANYSTSCSKSNKQHANSAVF
eukprot:6036761-Amphidinium_carterae.1